ncbi:hypothetical protein Tco_0760759 [Tanacetum coccineum]
MTQKDVLVNKLSNEMTETKGMLSQLMNQLAAQGVQLNLSSQLQVASDVTPMGAYEVDETQSSVVVRDKDARIKKKSNGLVTSEKSDGKQMLHNQALPNDCYKVSIYSSLVDAACIPDVGNNGLKIVKDGVGSFFAWPKNQVVLDEEDGKPLSADKSSEVSGEVFQKAHLYVIQNTNEIVPYIEFERELQYPTDSVSEYCKVDIYGITRYLLVKYEAYNINGYTFRTKSNDGIVYQNSGWKLLLLVQVNAAGVKVITASIKLLLLEEKLKLLRRLQLKICME